MATRHSRIKSETHFMAIVLSRCYKQEIFIMNYAKNFDFGLAICALKEGERVARKGWNGKGMYIFLETFETVNGDTHPNERYQPCIVMHTAQQQKQPGWFASQADMLAVDWQIID